MSLAKAMGFSDSTKLLIIHADDAGLSHSQNRATMQSLQQGMVNSYSIMVPCPWFYEMALFAKSHPQYDYGIHLTATCEWENYKFGPVLPIAEVPSLVDENGHFYKKRAQVKQHALVEELRKEFKAQIERAMQLGLRPSHLDSHMYSVGASPAFFAMYKELGEEYGLPVLMNKQLLEMVGLNPEQNLNEGDLLFDKAHVAEWAYFETGGLDAYYQTVFDNLVKGLNIILIHPAFDDEEMKGITVNHPNFGAAWRQMDFDFFTNNKNKQRLAASEVTLITWRDIKNVIYPSVHNTPQ